MTPDQVHELARQADEWAEAELLRRFPGHVFSRLSRHFMTIRDERFAELVRAEDKDGWRWRTLQAMRRSEVIAILQRPTVAHRYKPAQPYTLEEEVDAAAIREGK